MDKLLPAREMVGTDARVESQRPAPERIDAGFARLQVAMPGAHLRGAQRHGARGVGDGRRLHHSRSFDAGHVLDEQQRAADCLPTAQRQEPRPALPLAPAPVDEGAGRELARSAAENCSKDLRLAQPRQGEFTERAADQRTGAGRRPVVGGRVRPADHAIPVDHHHGTRPLFGHVPKELGRKLSGGHGAQGGFHG